MVERRAPRHRRIFLFFVAADIVLFALTWHSHLSYVGGPGKPTIMPVGQLLGWAAVVVVSLGLIAAAVTSYRARHLPSYHHIPTQPPVD